MYKSRLCASSPPHDAPHGNPVHLFVRGLPVLPLRIERPREDGDRVSPGRQGLRLLLRYLLDPGRLDRRVSVHDDGDAHLRLLADATRAANAAARCACGGPAAPPFSCSPGGGRPC